MPACCFVKFSRIALLDPVFENDLRDEKDPDQKISKGQGKDQSVQTLDKNRRKCKIMPTSLDQSSSLYNLALQGSKVLSPSQGRGRASH